MRSVASRGSSPRARRRGWPRSRPSSRYVATTSAGTDSIRRARRRRTSRVASSAQWRSSSTTTAGGGRRRSSASAASSAPGAEPPATAAASAPPALSAMSSSGPSGRGVWSASHAPHMTRSAPAHSARTSAVLPIPASPAMSTRRPRRSARTAARRPSRAPSSAARSRRPAVVVVSSGMEVGAMPIVRGGGAARKPGSRTAGRAARSVVVGVEHADPERGGEQTGVADDVGPRHRRAAQPLDPGDAVERAAAQLDAVDAHAGEVGLGEVAALEPDRAQERVAEVGLGEQALLEDDALEGRARERREVDAAVAENRVGDGAGRPLGAGEPRAGDGDPPRRQLRRGGVGEVAALDRDVGEAQSAQARAAQVGVDEPRALDARAAFQLSGRERLLGGVVEPRRGGGGGGAGGGAGGPRGG